MERHQESELQRRLEDLAYGTGRAAFKKWELLLWYGAERLTKRIWLDLRERFAELTEEEEEKAEFLIYSGGDDFALLHPDHIQSIKKAIGVDAEEAASGRAHTRNSVLLLRRAAHAPNRAWIVTPTEDDPGTPLVDDNGDRVIGSFTQATKERVREALNILHRKGEFSGVKGFSYHGPGLVATVNDDGVKLV